MISISHWGMFELSAEAALAVAIEVFAGRAALWKCDDSGWLLPLTPADR